MQYPQLPVFAFITAALVLVPLPWHWRARNVATVSMIIWLFAVDVIYGVNALIWAGNVNNCAPVWCDITTKIVVGVSYALPLATICICKHLEMVSSNRKVRFDSADKRRRMIFESIMCFGVPIIFMALHYIIQGHRFDIVENIGCQATLFVSIPAIMLVWFPQLLFSVITLIYAVIAIHHFIRRRITFAAHLQNSNSALTTNRYLRLIAMSITQLIWGTVFASLNLWNNVYPGLRPWTTWADVHSNFSRVDLYSMVGIPAEYLRMVFLFWWTMPVSSVIFFVFFGFGEEAKKEYRKVWVWFRSTVLRKNAEERSKYSTSFPSSHGNSRPLPLSTVASSQLKTPSSEEKFSTPSPASTGSFNPSSFRIMPPSLTKAEEADTDTYSISTLSYYGVPKDSMNQRSLSTHQDHISISDAYTSSRAVSPTPSVPTSVFPSTSERIDHGTEPEAFPIPSFHRPFSPPSIYPAVTVSPDAQRTVGL